MGARVERWIGQHLTLAHTLATVVGILIGLSLLWMTS